MSGINLLYIIEGGPIGGAEQLLLTVIKALDKTQYRVNLCLLNPSDVLENELKDSGVSIIVLNTPGKWDIFSIFRLIRFMRREKIDIVHSCLYTSNTFGRVAAILARPVRSLISNGARVPIIIAWEMGEVLSQTPVRHCKVDRILARFTDSIVACSKACKEEIIKKENIPAYKIRVIYNCVDLAKFNASSDTSVIRRQLGIKVDEILIGTVASLYNWKKGQEYLIRAMPQIIKVYPKIKLLLVGEGSSKSYFIQLANSLNIRDRVILTGFRRDIPEIMSALDLYICPSIREAFGISILEAMALKKPVVATRVGGTPELIIENWTGYLVPSKDVDSIACAIINLLADREKMQQMGEAGYRRVRAHFTSELIIKEIDSLYKELLWKKHPKSQ